jgi:hypothetical protein
MRFNVEIRGEVLMLEKNRRLGDFSLEISAAGVGFEIGIGRVGK